MKTWSAPCFDIAFIAGFDTELRGRRSLQFDAWRGLQRARPAESGRSGQQAGIARAAKTLEELGATIVGASFDTVEEQKRFADEQGFSFALISDPDRKIGELYGTARAADDPAVGFCKRTSFLISPDGLIAAIWDQDSITDFQTHGDEVLSEIRSHS